jgi:hypothetical protein
MLDDEFELIHLERIKAAAAMDVAAKKTARNKYKQGQPRA